MICRQIIRVVGRWVGRLEPGQLSGIIWYKNVKRDRDIAKRGHPPMPPC